MDETKAELEQQLLAITQQFLQESGATRASRSVTLFAQLEQDLGIGSLEKAELFHRVEIHFNVRLPESLLASAQTVKDIMDVLQKLSQAGEVNYKKSKKIELSALHVDQSVSKTLADVLTLYAEKDSSRAYIYLQEETGEFIITYGALHESALKVAAGLISHNVLSGDTVAIMLPTGADFFYAFYGAILAGCVPVPIYPPMRLNQIEEYAHKEATILYNAGVKILISFKEAKRLNKILQPFVPTLTEVTDVEALMKSKGEYKKAEIDKEDIALLQYTSGSTGNPKGVVLTHENLLANIRAYGEAINMKPSDVVVSWLPLYHDMGLIGTVMGCLYYGVPLILMSPLSFLSRPEKWFWAIHYRRATLSAAPNFAYELCAKKIRDEDLEGLDLSSWRLAFNGAEAIHPKTLDRFCDRFKRYGFMKKTFFPVYGLAECSVALTFPPVGREPLIDRIDAAEFETAQKAIPAKKLTHNVYEFVSCGSPLAGHKIRVVDDLDNVLAEREIGNLQFCGPSSMAGYYRNSEATEAVYHGGWWDTGDLGYLVDGELFITGRKKDLIIKAGRNYFPQEIEDAASDVPGVRKGCIAAFGVFDKSSGTEKLIVVVERNLRANLDEDEMITQINRNIAARIIISPDHVIVVPPRTIPKTSSGKLRRSSCKQMYLDSALTTPNKSTWIQLTKLIFLGFTRKLKKLVSVFFRFIYTLYVALVFLITFLPTRLIIVFQSRESSAKLIKKWSKLAIAMIFCHLKVVGEDVLAKEKPKLFVANHTSYVDVVLLMAVLPVDTRFVGKKELLKLPILGSLMKKLGHVFIDRLDITKSEADLARIMQEVDKGHPVLFFPEGTFTRVTGVRPFKLGPFKLASEKKIAVCPVAIANARGILRANGFLFSPRNVKITILPSKQPFGEGWDEIAVIRDWARKEISDHCGEKPIDLIKAGVQ